MFWQGTTAGCEAALQPMPCTSHSRCAIPLTRFLFLSYKYSPQLDRRALGTLCSALLPECPTGDQVLGLVAVLRVARTRGLWTSFDKVRAPAAPATYRVTWPFVCVMHKTTKGPC